jgi:hypothetical protein
MTFDVWDHDRLVEELVTAPHAVLAGRPDGPLLRALGVADARELTDQEIERFSRQWMSSPDKLSQPADVIEAAVLMAKLRDVERLDLACLTALALARGSVAAACALVCSDADALAVADSASELFPSATPSSCSSAVPRTCSGRFHSSTSARGEFGFFARYPVRCSRVIELLASWRSSEGSMTPAASPIGSRGSSPGSQARRIRSLMATRCR